MTTQATLPEQAWALLPVAALIGSLLGLGSLARGSEITVIRYGDAGHHPVPVSESDTVQPGDTVTVPERWF